MGELAKFSLAIRRFDGAEIIQLLKTSDLEWQLDVDRDRDLFLIFEYISIDFFSVYRRNINSSLQEIKC